jgi:hypothetical protein
VSINPLTTYLKVRHFRVRAIQKHYVLIIGILRSRTTPHTGVKPHQSPSERFRHKSWTQAIKEQNRR